jgi:hypothetical protein
MAVYAVPSSLYARIMGLSDGDQARPRRIEIEVGLWLVPLATLFAILVLAGIDFLCLGLAVMATDSCPGPPKPCPPGDAIDHAYAFAVIATSTGLLITFALFWRSVRPLRLLIAILTVLCAAWPALFVLVGNP